MSPNIVLSVEITRCKSDDTNWLCAEGEVCVCKISGTCTDGNLLVYEGSINNLLCAPEIDDDEAVIDWYDCGNPLEWVDVRADCEEGQSEEESIYVIEEVIIRTTTIPDDITTTTTRTITIDVTTTIEELEPCPIDWECCEGELYYEDEPCPIDMECIDHVCVPFEGDEEGGLNFGLVVGIIVVIIVVFFIYFFFLKKKGRMSFNKLYEKWT